MQPIAAFFLITLPWLNPFSSGPSPGVVSLLFSWTCAGVLLLVFLAPSDRGTGQRLVRAIAAAWLGAALVSSLLALLQYFGVTAAFGQWVNHPSMGEAYANLRQRNQFASLTNMALAALVWVIATGRATTAKHGLLALLCAALLAVGNAASSSRTGLVQLLMLCALAGVWGAWRRPLVLRVLLLSLVAYIASALLLPWLAGFDLSLHGLAARLRAGDETCASRLTLWSNVLHLIAQKPWLGWGWGELDYAHFITLYNEPRFCDILDNAHNLPLQLAVELGVPAAVLICGGFMWWVARQKPWRETDGTRQMAWAVMAVILLHSMLEYPLWYGPFQIAFGICAILLLWRQKPSLEAENTSKKASNWPVALILRSQTAIISIASILLLFIAFAAWDYHRISQIYLEPESRSAAYRTDTLNKIRSSWLFSSQVQFAELLVTPVTPANAAWTFNTAGQVLHYSPEPRVIEKRIESAVMLGKDDDALLNLARYRAAFPKEHSAWTKANQKPI